MISSPENFGLTAEETLAREIEDEAPEGFDAYWELLREEIEATPATWRGAIDGEINYVQIPSVRAVRIAGRVTMPVDKPRGLVIATHGSDAPDDFTRVPEPWSSLGLATLRIRVRGYPPSTMDIDDLRSDWIMHKLGVPDSWIVRGAVADIVQAYRCARRHFGKGMPISLHGESLGGGLAVIAAAQLAHLGDQPDRLAIALPSLGDWRWRQGRYCSGSGARINEQLMAARDEAPELMKLLLFFDAALHARAVRRPTLCKLAAADDVVPAPSAAAVFNALNTERRWRFVTSYGHFDGGIADLRLHARFERLHPRFVDPNWAPEEVIGDHLEYTELQRPNRRKSTT